VFSIFPSLMFNHHLGSKTTTAQHIDEEEYARQGNYDGRKL